MKITDLFTRIQKGSADTDGGKVSRLIQPVQPVGVVGKLTLVPGQLLQGEVVGEDSNGLLLLKLAGEIISARTPMKLDPGQQFWFEVKEAGDSPLLNIASQKGAIQELLKEIMGTRPLLVKAQPPVDPPPAPSPSQQPSPALQSSPSSLRQAVSGTAPPPATPLSEFQGQYQGRASAQAPPYQPQQVGSQVLPVVAPDGKLPAESVRLVRALVALVDTSKSGMLSQQEMGGSQKIPALIKIISTLIRDEQIPPSLQKVEGFANVIQAGARAGLEAVPPQNLNAGNIQGEDTQPLPGQEGRRASYGAPVSNTAVASSAQAALAPETIKILNALVAISGIRPPTADNQGPLQPAANPDQNLAEILSVIGKEGKIPKVMQQLSPMKILMNPAASIAEEMLAATKQPFGGQETQHAGDGGGLSKAAFPLQYAAAQQGAEPLPGQLRLLASLMGLGSKASGAVWREIEDILVRIPEAEMPAATRKFAAFFEAHSRLNEELAAPAGGQSDFYIMPSVFAGQAGWGEWLWSKEEQPGNNDGKSQENLVFFLEMSNLGALTIQILLKEKKLRGQITMSDKKGSELVASLLPGLQPRLEALGYDLVDFSCTCQPVNLMQDLKENLYSQIGSGTVSLLDVQV